MGIPDHIVAEIRARLIEQRQRGYPEGADLHVAGSIGYDAYIDASGFAYLETYDIGSEEPPVRHSVPGAQIVALVLGSKHMPALAELLPARPPEAADCQRCQGRGSRKFGPVNIICLKCVGLGWPGAAEFEWPG